MMHTEKMFNLRDYEAVVFDFDMTLADTSHIIVNLLNETVMAFGYDPKTYDQLLPAVGNTHMIMLSAASGEYDQRKLLEMQAHYRKLCKKRMPEETTFFYNVIPCIKQLYDKKKKLGILSQKLRSLLIASLEKYDIAKYFGGIIGGDDNVLPKPAPDGLWQIGQLLNVSPDKILYIGDSYIDEQAAESAKVDFCAMLLGGTKAEQFSSKNIKKMFSDWKDFEKFIINEDGDEH